MASVFRRIGGGIVAVQGATLEIVGDIIGDGRPVGNVMTVPRGTLKGHLLGDRFEIGARPAEELVAVA